jgi:pimeloyl-ACP methyl ester carboxylesterase
VVPARRCGSAWNIPTTLIWGEKDQINPVANAQALVDLLPSARLILVPEAGHNVQHEKAEVGVAAITAPVDHT